MGVATPTPSLRGFVLGQEGGDLQAGADWQLACAEGARLRLTQDHGDGWANVELVEGAGGSTDLAAVDLEDQIQHLVLRLPVFP